jgi:periplasmic copper chaperone A
MKMKAIVAVVALAALAAPAAVFAHAELSPSTAPGGDLAHLTLDIPNESATSNTTKISVQIPKEVLLARFAPKAGWKRTVTTEKLSTTSTVGENSVSERVATVTWTGGAIAPGEFDTFDLSVSTPDTVGTELVFPTVQTYADGTVTRWIGDSSADEPAPHVTVAAAEEGAGHGAPETPAPAAVSTGGSAKTNAALGFGIAGLVAGLAALAIALLRRRDAAERA